MTSNCTCGQPTTFKDCCGRFLDGDQIADTPEQLMRSRYSAFACGGYGQYLLDTWSPSETKKMTNAARSVDWVELQVLDSSQHQDDGMVEFNAYFLDGNGERRLLHEKSVFQRVAGHWLYVSGEVKTG